MTGHARDKMLADFAAGRLMVICNVQLLVEGVDIRNRWWSATYQRQWSGCRNDRGLRPADNKAGLIIFDHVGNCLRHGLPDDDREWSLEGKEKGKKEISSRRGKNKAVRDRATRYFAQARRHARIVALQLQASSANLK